MNLVGGEKLDLDMALMERGPSNKEGIFESGRHSWTWTT